MVAEVIVDISTSEIDRVFDYLVPDDLAIHEGDRVEVNFAGRNIEGIVVKLKESSDVEKIKPINRRLDEFTAVLPEMLDLMHFMQKKYNLRLADILRLFIPVQLRGGKVKELVRNAVRFNYDLDYETVISSIRVNAVAQRGVLAKLYGIDWEWHSALAQEFGAQAIKTLADKGFIQIFEQTVQRKPYNELHGEGKKPKLTDEQVNAVNEIMKGGESLLFGVTGSGKTEVYLDCIERVLEQGQTAIMLVPEISLTPQTMNRFRGRFGDKVALLHSGLSAGERYDEWLSLLNGKAKIAVGARSAIYAPLRSVGIIIIDEEHDSSYTSESNPRYDTAVIAEFRAKYNNAILVKGSATPSMSSYKQAVDGKSKLVRMQNRVNKRVLPQIEIVDMCEEIKKGNRTILSNAFVDGIKQTLDKGEQAMVFINRRGYSSFMMCRKCGFVLKCDQCDVSLTYHREENRLKCHYCGSQFTVPRVCPECGSDSIRYGRDGTEKIVADLQKLFPSARFIRMDNDTTRGKTGHLSILTSFKNGEADILVGTQMIAKGHDFPKVTFVGILDADLSLYIGDYMAVEKTFQLVTQVAGRAGRDKLPGRVILQSYSPNHYVFYYASRYDYEGFFKKEINVREVTMFPPFVKIIRVLFTDTNEDHVFEATKAIVSELRQLSNEHKGAFVSLKAMKSPVKKVENKYRYQIIAKLKIDTAEEMTSEIYRIVNNNKFKGVSVFVEQNPQNLS